MECRLWVACEWIIHCATLIFHTNLKEELDEKTTQLLQTGSLCNGVSPVSIERWKFWKKRFLELIADAGSLELDSTITKRMSDALRSMIAAEESVTWFY